MTQFGCFIAGLTVIHICPDKHGLRPGILLLASLDIHLPQRYAFTMGGVTLWITGLPGSGKSTIADAVKEIHPEFVILRMDELRRVVTPNPSYSESERDLVYRSIVYLAKQLSELGHHVIIDATGNRKKWRDLARDLIPEYAEVFLKCPLEEASRRETARGQTHGAPEDIYEKGKEGWPVPGVTVPYEEPVDPEIVIGTDMIPVEEAVRTIDSFLTQRLSRPGPETQ